jgi:hypothetical protein
MALKICISAYRRKFKLGFWVLGFYVGKFDLNLKGTYNTYATVVRRTPVSMQSRNIQGHVAGYLLRSCMKLCRFGPVKVPDSFRV